jgi:hypothetical protein
MDAKDLRELDNVSSPIAGSSQWGVYAAFRPSAEHPFGRDDDLNRRPAVLHGPAEAIHRARHRFDCCGELIDQILF